MDIEDDDDSPLKMTPEGIAASSAIVLLVLVILRYAMSGFWEETQSNILLYYQIGILVCLILLGVGALPLLKGVKSMIRSDLLGSILMGVGFVVMNLGPMLTVMGLNGASHMDSLYLVIPGIALIALGAVTLARNDGFMGAWIVGVFGFFLLMIFRFVGESFASDEDGALSVATLTSLGIVISSSVLYVYGEIKHIYLLPMIKEANELRRKKKYDEAMAKIEKVLKINPTNRTALNNKGNILVNMKKTDEAIDCYNQVLKLDPDYGIAQENLRVVQSKSTAKAS